MSSKTGFRYLILSMAALLTTMGMFDLAKGQLTRTNGLYGGIVNSLVTENDEMYAVTPEFLYRYDKAQEEWKILNIRYPHTSFPKFTTKNGNLFLGWREEMVYGGNQVSMLKSDDQGETWQNISPPNSEDGLRSLYSVGDYLFIFTKEGRRLFSEDEGESWQEIDFDDHTIAKVVKTDDNYFIRTFTAIHRSDHGISWEKLNIDLPITFKASLVQIRNYIY